MDSLISWFGADGAVAFIVFCASVLRAGKAERVHMIDGLTSAFAPFLVISCLLVLLQYGINTFGIDPPTKVIMAAGGLLGYQGNSWLTGLQKDGKTVEQDGAIKSLGNLIKSLTAFFKKTD